jgi:hypothetical protein
MRVISWNDRSLRTRLMITFAAVVVLSSVVGAFAVLQLGRVNATHANVTRRALPGVRALGNIGLATARRRRRARRSRSRHAGGSWRSCSACSS